MGVENQELFRKMFQHTLENETYFDYLHNNLNGFEEDRAFALSIFKEDIANSELLYSFFEEKSINWLDDLDLCCSMVLKSLKAIKLEEEFIPMPLFKENDDEKVARYMNGLRYEIQDEMSMITLWNVEDAYQMTLKSEEKLS